jgi:hypothetical protein
MSYNIKEKKKRKFQKRESNTYDRFIINKTWFSNKEELITYKFHIGHVHTSFLSFDLYMYGQLNIYSRCHHVSFLQMIENG